MKLISKKYIILLVAILFLGALLRLHNLNTWPRFGATFDEYAWTWQGMNLIQKGVPISWSPHKAYTHYQDITYQKVHFRIVHPFLEHPPVFGLVAGSFAILNGAHDMYHLRFNMIRPLALILGVLSIVMVFLLAKNLYGTKIGLLSALLYATIPSIVVGSRIVQNENFLIPLWLLTLFLISKFLTSKNSWYRNIAAVICGLLALSKVPYLAAAFSVVIILLASRKYKDIFLFLLIVLPIFSLFFVYGIAYDKDLFFSLWGLQLNRYDIEFTSMYALFQKPYLVDRFYIDGWIYWGWFSFVLLLTREYKKHVVLISGLLSYFLVFVAAIPDEPGHGWYRYPFYPFLTIALAIFIYEYLAKNWILTFLFFLFIGTTLLQNTWFPTFGFSYLIFRMCIIGWSIMLIPQYLPILFIEKKLKIVSIVWIVAFIFLNVWSVMIYNEQ